MIVVACAGPQQCCFVSRLEETRNLSCAGARRGFAFSHASGVTSRRVSRDRRRRAVVGARRNSAGAAVVVSKEEEDLVAIPCSGRTQVRHEILTPTLRGRRASTTASTSTWI